VVNLLEQLRAVWRELYGADPKTCSQTGYSESSCMDGLASQAKHCAGPSPFAAYSWN